MMDLLKRFGYVPRQAVWELTLACDMKCRHCGSRAGRPRSDELTTPEALKLAKELAAAGCKRLTLSGGEPLLRQDWPLLCQTLVSAGVRVNMISNGRKFTEKLAKRAKAFGLEGISFSLDGLEPTHEYIRRVKGHWKKVIENFDIARDAGLPAGAVTMIVRQTIDELDEIREILKEHGVRTWQLQLGNPTGNAADNADMIIYPEDMLRVIPKAAELRKMEGYPKVYIGDNLGYFGEYEADLRDQDGLIPFWIGCRAGCSVVGIESNGNIKGCLSLPSAMNEIDSFVEGNIRERPFREIWNDPDKFAYNRKFKAENLVGFCRSCEYAEVCRGGCAWTSFAHSGSRYEFLHCYHRVKSLVDSGKLQPHEKRPLSVKALPDEPPPPEELVQIKVE
jgi:radical SAM protein with 4Fe4S-binding SPASM domain